MRLNDFEPQSLLEEGVVIRLLAEAILLYRLAMIKLVFDKQVRY